MTNKYQFRELLEHAKQVIGNLDNGEDYLDFIRSLPCMILGGRSDPHHVKSRGAGGSDFLCIPLSRKYHTEIEVIGIGRFEKKHGIDITKTIKTLHKIYKEQKDKGELWKSG